MIKNCWQMNELLIDTADKWWVLSPRSKVVWGVFLCGVKHVVVGLPLDLWHLFGMCFNLPSIWPPYMNRWGLWVWHRFDTMRFDLINFEFVILRRKTHRVYVKSGSGIFTPTNGRKLSWSKHLKTFKIVDVETDGIPHVLPMCVCEYSPGSPISSHSPKSIHAYVHMATLK